MPLRTSDFPRVRVVVVVALRAPLPVPLPLRHVVGPRERVVLKGLLEHPVPPLGLLGAPLALLVAPLGVLRRAAAGGAGRKDCVPKGADRKGKRRAERAEVSGGMKRRWWVEARAPAAAGAHRRPCPSPRGGVRTQRPARSSLSGWAAAGSRRRSAGRGVPACWAGHRAALRRRSGSASGAAARRRAGRAAEGGRLARPEASRRAPPRNGRACSPSGPSR